MASASMIFTRPIRSPARIATISMSGRRPPRLPTLRKTLFSFAHSTIAVIVGRLRICSTAWKAACASAFSMSDSSLASGEAGPAA